MSTPAANAINYTPSRTIAEFIKDHRKGELFYDWIVGPVGSAKTTGIFFKLIYMAGLQEPGPDGIRRTRAVIVRNTMPQLRDTTLVSWNYWFRDGQAGKWQATQNKFTLRYGDVECEVLFRPLDTPDDVARVLSLEVTFAIIDEFVQIPREIVEALSARLGRYPSAKDGGATNWGMWGSSNPDTEDNWWFDHLHNPDVVVQPKHVNLDEDGLRAAYALLHPDAKVPNAKYFLQPSGFSPDAENLENLPGGRGYYENQAIGKTDAWIKQFLEAEWGYSAAGRPVIPSFHADMHISSKPVQYDPKQPIVIGFDPGVGGLAAIIGQEDAHGRLRVLGEIIEEGMGAMRFATDVLRPYLRRRFPGCDVVIAPDPAAASRASTDESTIVSVLRRFWPVKIETNNRLPLRINAIEHYTSRLTDVGPALIIDAAECPTLVRALKGGWRYVLDSKHGVVKGVTPEKNAYSHPGDAFGYLCRYYHRGAERVQRRKNRAIVRQTHARPHAGYHIR